MGSAELEALLQGEERLVLVEFWTARCEPCRQLRDHLERVAGDHPHVRVVAIDADREAAAAGRHGVREFPTLVFFKRGQELARFRGGALPPSTLRLLE